MGFKEIPSKPEQTESRNWLMDLIRRNVQFPTRQVPGMSGAESQGYDLLNQWLGNTTTPSGVKTGMATLEQFTKGQDPLTSPYWRGMREQSLSEENRLANAMQRGTRIRGAADSSGGATMVGNVRRNFANDRMALLGGLYEQDQNRRLTAAPQLIQSSDYFANEPLRKSQAAMTLGGLPREIESQQEQAIYDSLVQTLLFPYMQQAGLAQNIINEPRYYYKEGPKKSWASGALSGAAQGAAIGGPWGALIGGVAGGVGQYNA